jgi:hypothetical protein
MTLGGDAEPDWLRDLRWLLLSPPLLSTAPGALPAAVQHFDAQERECIANWLDDLAGRPSAWPAALVDAPPALSPPPRLGRYAEQLLGYFLSDGPTHCGVAAHVPLRRELPGGGALTLGEIDFLVQDRAGRRWHWELAVKFFVCTAAPGTAARVEDHVGPQRNDSLDRKLHKLFQRQLRHTPPAPWDAEVWQPAAFVRGCLFYADPSLTSAALLPAELNPAHQRARWVRAERLAGLHPGPWRRVPRSRWMAPSQAPAQGAGQALGHDALRVLLQETWAAAPGVAVMLARHADGVETERVLVLPPGW